MSIKRTKQTSRGRGRDADSDSGFPSARPPEPVVSWKEQVDGKPDDAFTPYALSATFQKGALLVHPKFGRGVVTGVEGQRIEVLFEEGSKKLGHATA